MGAGENSSGLFGSKLCRAKEAKGERPLYRLIRKANKIALKLGLGSWRDTPHERPPHMHLATFERLKTERAALVAQINQGITRKLALKGLLATMS